MKKLLIASIPILSLLAVSCGRKPETAGKAQARPPVTVQTVAVTSADWPERYEATGTVRARTQAVISAKVMGYVQTVSVQAGDRVEQGRLLVAVDARDMEAQLRRASAALNEARSAAPEVESGVAAAQANLELAEVTFRRIKDLFDKKSVSNQEFDEAGARLKAAQAGFQMALARRQQLQSKIAQAEEAVKSAEIMLGYSKIIAPFTGLVTEKRVSPGDLAAPGAPLLTLESEGGYRLEASVSESRIVRIRTGQSVSIVLDALDKRLTARVSEIVPAVDDASRSYIVKADLPPVAGLRAGMFGRAVFELGARKTISVPAGAIIERGQLRSVFVVENGAARSRLVTVGELLENRREVLSGLNPGELVIFPVPAGLEDGGGVEVRQ